MYLSLPVYRFPGINCLFTTSRPNDDDKFIVMRFRVRRPGSCGCGISVLRKGRYVTELGKVEGSHREDFEAWSSKEKTEAILG